MAEALGDILALFRVYPSKRSEAPLMACFSANDG
jgi:hypothetical protein